ncbi:putative exonuclease GOR [Haemaphysalis longicornis]
MGTPRQKNTPAQRLVSTSLPPGVTSGVHDFDRETCSPIRGLEVTKVSVVGWNGTTIYQPYVRPSSPVLDFNRSPRGVTAEDVRGVQTRLQDVQAALLRLFSASTVMVGQVLVNALSVLKLLHGTIDDTTVVFPPHRGPPF